MSQHDMDILNAANAAVRADLNLALKALASISSGATEPGTMYAYQFWADTTTGLLKQRNAANSGWITIGTMATLNLGLAALAGSASQTFSVAAATAAAHATAYSQLDDGWVSDFNTWTYASASTFTVAGDHTATFTKGTKLGWTQTTAKFGHVASSSFGGGNTTVTILVNEDYTIANAAITLQKFSRADKPVGFPSHFGFASTIVGLTIGAVVIYYRLEGGFVNLKFTIQGTSNAANFTASVPIACATADTEGYAWGVGAGVLDNAVWQTAPAAIGIAHASSTLNFGKTPATFDGNVFAGFTTSAGKGVKGDFCYPY